MRRLILLAVVTLIACSSPGLQVTTEPDAADANGASDLVAEDLGGTTGQDLVDFTSFGDGIEFETQQPNCEAGTGCFLDPCDSNQDCLEGWCVDHLGESVCTKTCQEECPPGWSCQQAAVGQPDMAWICVSGHAHLCKPCVDAEDCKGVGGTEDVCVSYGEDGSFCGGLCENDGDCPWGFSCIDANTVDGIPVLQCVADTGECPCTPKSISLGLFTECEKSNDFGTCVGKRICEQDGLSQCDAAEPAPETCNGIDDDCDGDIDEPYDLTVDPPIGICNDDNPCTVDSCQGAEGCTYELLDEGECLDDDACTVGDHCEAGVCVGLPVDCDDDNPCTDDVCDGLGGCQAEFNDDDCDDGNPCTVGDRCQAGTCTGISVSCDCAVDADCAEFDDGDPCTGQLFCDQSKLPYRCEIVPDSVVTCELPQDAHPFCQAAVCNSDTGGCEIVPDHEGFACDDEDACTVGEHCQAGACVGGVAANCNDGSACTTDSCDSQSGCQHTAIEGLCSDDNACTVGDVCVDGLCQPGAESLACDDDNVCTEDACEPSKGCVHAPLSQVPCDDGNKCTQGDVCTNGKCVFAGDVDCDDDNPCTTDSCLSNLGCVHVDNALPCDDGDACTAGDTCAAGECVAGGDVDCDDGNQCTVDVCDAQLGCLHDKLNGGPCDDANACTQGDACVAGACVPSGDVDCDDKNQCTNDSCQSAIGCVHLNNALPCDDGDACTAGDSCVDGQCLPEVPVDCDDDNPCTVDTCDEAAGCLHKKVPSGPCDDGNACTINDACSDGVCVAQALDCDDQNPCTDDSCDPVDGCVYSLNQSLCDDGNLCTTGDHCQLGECVSTAPLKCVDGNPCTSDACEPTDGCVFNPIKGECDDNNACTLNEQCQNGFCTAKGWLDCDDNNACTDDFCDPLQGCLNQPNADPCDDGNPCTANDACVAGACTPSGPTNCNDNNVCTDDSCDPDQGCIHTNNTGGCSDGNSCTLSDTCVDGACISGPELVCNDANPCTDDSCDPVLACVYVANDASCNDGDNCTENSQDHCEAGVCVGGPSLDCNDDNPCTVDSCNEAFACEHAALNNGADCGNGNVCWNGLCVSCGDQTGSQTFSYTGSVQQFEVPACIESLTVETWGAQGGDASIGVVYGGKGGYAKGTLSVTPGETLSVYVGGKGSVTAGGWNGGGNGGAKGSCGGGGASDVRKGGSALSDRVIVGSGGGGAAWESAWSGGWGVNNGACNGGAGGGLTGNKGGYWQSSCQGGDGGSQNAGGSANGAFGVGGKAQPGDGDTGGGGGGWYGGGGGGACTGYNGCGGGGSSYVGGVSNGTTLGGKQSGNGQVVITW